MSPKLEQPPGMRHTRKSPRDKECGKAVRGEMGMGRIFRKGDWRRPVSQRTGGVSTIPSPGWAVTTPKGLA